MRRILWLNGAFGAGKSTTALHIAGADPSWHLFDPEWVGYMLRANLHGHMPDDFQDLPAWRTLVPRVAHEVASTTGSDLLAVQTVLNEAYWRQIRSGMSSLGLGVFHVVLDVGEDALRERIAADAADPGAAGWRLGHVDAWIAARGWMTSAADLVVDASVQGPEEVSRAVLAALA